MDLSKLSRAEIIGIVSSALLLFSLFFLDWYSLEENPTRALGDGFICGQGNFTCTGFETFPILRWLLIGAAAAPLILMYIDARGKKLSWPPGELTMVVGCTAFVLIFYNGILDPPGNQFAEIGITKQIGYYLALLATIGIAGAGMGRVAAGQRGQNMRKTPGTV